MKRLLVKLAPVAGEIGWLLWRSMIFLGEVALLIGVIVLALGWAYVLGPVK